MAEVEAVTELTPRAFGGWLIGAFAARAKGGCEPVKNLLDKDAEEVNNEPPNSKPAINKKAAALAILEAVRKDVSLNCCLWVNVGLGAG